MMPGKNEYDPEPTKVITITREKYRGETDLEFQVKSEQVGFYKWGTVVFQLMVIILLTALAVSFILFLLSIVAGVVGWMIWQQVVESLQNITLY